MDLATRNEAMQREGAAAEAVRIQRAEMQQRELEVLRLYAVGATLNQLAKAAGVKTTGGALKFVRRALEKYAGIVETTPITEARALMMQRLELVLGGHLPAAAMGDEKSAKVALSALAQQARLLGLDAPKKHEHEHHLSNDGPTERAAREQSALKSLTEFGQRDNVLEGEIV